MKKPWAIMPGGFLVYVVHREGGDWIIKWPRQLKGRPTSRRHLDNGPNTAWHFMVNGDEVLLTKTKLICNAGGTLMEVPMTEEEIEWAKNNELEARP